MGPRKLCAILAKGAQLYRWACGVVVLALAGVLSGCGTGGSSESDGDGGDRPVRERESIEEFDVRPLDPAKADHMCDLITAEEAEKLGLTSKETQEARGIPAEGKKMGGDCYWVNEGRSLTLQKGESPPSGRTAVWHVISDADLDSEAELLDVGGYPGSTLRFSEQACDVTVATLDKYSLTLKAQTPSSEDACAFGERAAEKVVGNAPPA